MDLIYSLLIDHTLAEILIAEVISVPSLLLYIAEAALILTHGKQFDSAFYRLFFIRALLQIVSYLNNYAYMRFGRLGLFYSLYEAAGSVPIMIVWFLLL